MRWVTRADCHVDRTACAWLIQRFVDPDADFSFVTDAADLPPGAIPFDVPGHPFSHHDGDSTFEVMVRHYGITKPGIKRLAELVHQADLEDDRFDAPEAEGLVAIVAGLGELLGDDQRLLDETAALYDGLLRHFGGAGP